MRWAHAGLGKGASGRQKTSAASGLPPIPSCTTPATSLLSPQRCRSSRLDGSSRRRSRCPNGDGGDGNPLCRGPNLDLVLLHLVRAIQGVDVARLVLHGGSAGGYTALLLAAETFPAAATTVNAPVVNLCYEAAFAVKNRARARAEKVDPAGHPFLTIT